VSVSVALQPPAAVYREEQLFAWWVYAPLVLMVLGAGLVPALRPDSGPAAHARSWSLEVPLALAVGLVLPTVLIVGVLRMTTEVRPGELRVWFGWIPTYRRAVVLDAVKRLEVVRYRPIADYGFWGIRHGRDGERVLSARGDRGVRLHFADGSRLLIGSQRPEALALALEEAMRPAGC
jgi:hypothetical protein